MIESKIYLTAVLGIKLHIDIILQKPKFITSQSIINNFLDGNSVKLKATLS